MNNLEIKEKLSKKKICIVGGGGFIGHNLSIQLSELGAKVHVIDNLQVNNLGFYTSNYLNNPNSERYLSFINSRLKLMKESEVNLHIEDARDYHRISRILDDIKPDSVIHLAAVAHANRSNKDPYTTFDHSLRTLENVLDSIKQINTHLIYLSSSMVYGNFDNESVSEERICNPLGIYGALKFAAEKIIIGYNQVFDIPYTIIRPSALYGERCVSRRVGQAFIENALDGKDLTINGDGEESLDFTYIDDLIQGIVLSIVNKKAKNEIFNITFGSSRKINNLAELVKSKFEGIEVKYNPRDSLMPERGTLSVEKAKSLLGYHPNNPIEKGFIKYIYWYKKFALNNPNLFQKKCTN